MGNKKNEKYYYKKLKPKLNRTKLKATETVISYIVIIVIYVLSGTYY